MPIKNRILKNLLVLKGSEVVWAQQQVELLVVRLGEALKGAVGVPMEGRPEVGVVEVLRALEGVLGEGRQRTWPSSISYHDVVPMTSPVLQGGQSTLEPSLSQLHKLGIEKRSSTDDTRPSFEDKERGTGFVDTDSFASFCFKPTFSKLSNSTIKCEFNLDRLVHSKYEGFLKRVKCV